MTLEEAKALRPGDLIKWPDDSALWIVVRVVERGVVFKLRSNGSHNFLRDWPTVMMYDKAQ